MMLDKFRFLLSGTLRRQLIWGVAGVHAVMMGLFIWDLTIRQQEMLLDQQTNMATALAESVATSSAVWVASRDLAGLQEVIEAQRRYTELSFAMILNQQGVVLAHTDRQHVGQYGLDLPDRIELQVLSHTPTLVDVINPVMVAGRHVGWIRVGIGQATTHKQLERIIQEGILYALLAMVIGGLLAAFMAKRLTRRLDDIQAVADAVQAGASHARVVLSGSDEAAQLGRQFNGMLDVLADHEREITASRDALQLTQYAVDHIQDGVFWVDRNGMVLNVNEHACSSLGYAHDELLGMHIWDFDLDFASTDWAAFFARKIREGQVVIETRHRHRDGTVFPVEISANYVRYGDKEYGFSLVRDISERKRVEQSRQEALDRLKKIASLVPGVVYQFRLRPDGSSCFPFASEAIREIYRVSPEEVREDASKVFAILHPDDYDGIGASIQASARDLTPWRHEYRVKFDDGTVRWLFGDALPQREEDGSVLWHGFIAEITERKRAEELLHQSEAKLRTLYNSTSDAVILLDEKGFFDCNKATLTMFGCATREEFYSKHPADLSPPQQPCGTDSMTLANRQIATAMENGSNHFEWMHQRVDTGKVFSGDVLLNSMELDGKLVIQATVRDITERKNNEAQIERLSQAYRLLSRANEAIVRTQDRNELFTTICSAAVELEFFRFVWIGMLDEKRSLVIPVAYAGVDEGYTTKLNIRLDDERTGHGPVGSAIRTDHHVICQDIENDPSMVPWRDEALKRGYRSSGVFPFREAGAVVGAINIYAVEAHFFTPDIIRLMLELAADISFALDVFVEKNRREQAEGELNQLNLELESRVLERTYQLETVNRELEAFSYSVSHDLRAPLRSIDGFSQILSKNYNEQLDAKGRDYLDRVRRASQRMGHLIDDLLRLSQVSRSSLKRVQVDLSKIAEKVADDLRKINPGRIVQFTLQQCLVVHADPGLLSIVMDNLLGNAYKYSGKKAAVEIEFGVRDINGERTFFVRDNGDGFNMDYAHKLFGAFQRLHGVNEFEGTGIGLATVQRIIHRHHGSVWAEAQEGQGATFYFTLPQRQRET